MAVVGPSAIFVVTMKRPAPCAKFGDTGKEIVRFEENLFPAAAIAAPDETVGIFFKAHCQPPSKQMTMIGIGRELRLPCLLIEGYSRKRNNLSLRRLAPMIVSACVNDRATWDQHRAEWPS